MSQNVVATRIPWRSRWPALWGFVVFIAHLLVPFMALLWLFRKLGGAYTRPIESGEPADTAARVVRFYFTEADHDAQPGPGFLAIFLIPLNILGVIGLAKLLGA